MAKSKAKLRLSLVLLSLGSLLASIAPLVVVLIKNRARYFTTQSDTTKICIGGMLCLAFMVVKVMGKLRTPRRIVLFGTAFLMSWLMATLLVDLVLLSAMALLGELIDAVLFAPLIKAVREKMLVNKTASATAVEVEEVFKKYLGRV